MDELGSSAERVIEAQPPQQEPLAVTRLKLGFILAGVALTAVVAGGGGFRAGPAALFEFCALGAAAFAASLPARSGPPLAGALGVALAALTLLSAALAPYRFASLDRWALWASALLLAWSLSRLERACETAEVGRRASSLVLLLASVGVLLLQVAGGLGFHPGGEPERLSAGSFHGSFASTNHLGEILLLLFVAALFRVDLRSALGRGHALVALVAGSGILLGSSRILPVALASALGAWALTRLRRRSLTRPALALSALVAVLFLAAAAQVISSRSHEGDAWRRPQIWAAVAPAMLERPSIGLGPGSFRHAHHLYNFPVDTRVGRFAQSPTTPHGEWLRLPIELGTLGCLLLALLVVARLRAGRAREAWPLIAALLPVAAVHDFLQAPAVAAWTAVVFVACSAGAPRTELRPAILGARVPQRSLALALIAALAAAGLVLRPTLADRAARAGDLSAAFAWNVAQPFRWLQVGARSAEGRPDPRRLSAAMLCLREAEALAPRLPEPPRDQARLLADATRRFLPDPAGRDAAAAAWDRAAERAPHDVFLLLEQAVFLAQTGAPERALALAERALELEPRCTDAALLALIASRSAGRDELVSLERARLLLEALPALRARASKDYERELIEPDERLLERAGLRDRSRP